LKKVLLVGGVERPALNERGLIRALAKMFKMAWLLKTLGSSVCSRIRRWVVGLDFWAVWSPCAVFIAIGK
jgi:hypothetical protein